MVERTSATLYRTDRGESPIGEALLEAARRGKHVRVVVELKARFDERRNAEWSRALHAAGAQGIHAPAGLKVHAKTLLIERREADCLRRYTHVSSGNYSAFTSRAYTDFGLLTCDEAIASDVAELFEMMTGDGPVPALRAVIAAPYALRRGFSRLVEREMTWARLGEAAHIILKMIHKNSSRLRVAPSGVPSGRSFVRTWSGPGPLTGSGEAAGDGDSDPDGLAATGGRVC